MTEQEYLDQRLQHQLDWYSEQARRNQRWYRRLRMAEIIIAAAIPFFSTWLAGESASIVVVGLMGVAIVVISGLLVLYRYQENWIEYRMTAESLKREKFFYLTCSPPYDGANAFPLLVERIEGLFAREGSSWAGSMQQMPLSVPAADSAKR